MIEATDFGTGVSLVAASGMALTALGMVLTPGPNMVYLVSRSVSQGPAAGMISLAGTCAGFLVYMTMANLGLTMVFVAVPWLYAGMKAAGVLYFGLPRVAGTQARRSWRFRSWSTLARFRTQALPHGPPHELAEPKNSRDVSCAHSAVHRPGPGRNNCPGLLPRSDPDCPEHVGERTDRPRCRVDLCIRLRPAELDEVAATHHRLCALPGGGPPRAGSTRPGTHVAILRMRLRRACARSLDPGRRGTARGRFPADDQRNRDWKVRSEPSCSLPTRPAVRAEDRGVIPRRAVRRIPIPARQCCGCWSARVINAEVAVPRAGQSGDFCTLLSNCLFPPGQRFGSRPVDSYTRAL